MDGDGCIQVNHWRKQYLQYRLVIKLSNLSHNYVMLIKIAKVIGGIVRFVNNNNDVLWVIDSKETIINTISIFEKYPPLTSRLTCQLEFLKFCLKNNSVNLYLNNRNNKYNNKFKRIKSFELKSKANIFPPKYFPSWLSGFIEAEGCFCIRTKQNNSFSIGQYDDLYILYAIKDFFKINNKIRNPKKNFFLLEVYNRETLYNIKNHFYTYPLLGNKTPSLFKFINLFK